MTHDKYSYISSLITKPHRPLFYGDKFCNSPFLCTEVISGHVVMHPQRQCVILANQFIMVQWNKETNMRNNMLNGNHCIYCSFLFVCHDNTMLCLFDGFDSSASVRISLSLHEVDNWSALFSALIPLWFQFIHSVLKPGIELIGIKTQGIN